MSIALRRASHIQPLAISRVADSGSSTEPSPSNPLSDSGSKFRIGGFEIGRDGVTETRDQEPAVPADGGHRESEQPEGSDSAPPRGIDFRELQMLQIIGRGASGFVRRAEHLPTVRACLDAATLWAVGPVSRTKCALSLRRAP